MDVTDYNAKSKLAHYPQLLIEYYQILTKVRIMILSHFIPFRRLLPKQIILDMSAEVRS